MSDNNEDIRIEHCEGSRRSIQQVLDACREERRPYVLIKKDLKEHSKLATILVPITMLEEEVYKAIISVIDNEQMKSNFAKKAKERVFSNYSIPVVWQQLTDIWGNNI